MCYFIFTVCADAGLVANSMHIFTDDICIQIVQQPKTLANAKKYCRLLEIEGVSYNARLASDKDPATQLSLRRAVSLKNITELYTGVSLTVSY